MTDSLTGLTCRDASASKNCALCLKPLLLSAATPLLSHCKQLLQSALERRKIWLQISVRILPVGSTLALFETSLCCSSGSLFNTLFTEYNCGNLMIVKIRN